MRTPVSHDRQYRPVLHDFGRIAHLSETARTLQKARSHVTQQQAAWTGRNRRPQGPGSQRRPEELPGCRTTSLLGNAFYTALGPDRVSFLTVHHDTLYLRSSSRGSIPPRWSRRITSYSSTLDICGMPRADHQEQAHTARARNAVPTELVNITRPWIGVPPKLGFWPNFRGTLTRCSLTTGAEMIAWMGRSANVEPTALLAP